MHIATGSGFVFISYCHGDDRAYVVELAAFLDQHGVGVWYDEEIVTGARWARTIREKIDTCGAFVVVMTPAAEASDWVDREVAEAQALKKPILPLLLGGTRFFSLNNIQYEDVSDGRMPGTGFLTRLRSALSAGPATVTARAHLEPPVHIEPPVDVEPLAPVEPPAAQPRTVRARHLVPFLAAAVLVGIVTVVLTRHQRDSSALRPATAGSSGAVSGSSTPSGHPTPGTPAVLATLGPEDVSAFDFSPDGTVLAAADTMTSVRLWSLAEIARPALLGTITLSDLGYSYVSGVAFSPDGDILAVDRFQEKLELWNVRDRGRPTKIITMDTTSAAPDFSPTRPVLATAGLDGAALLWNISDPARPALLNTINLKEDIYSAAFDADGNLLATSSMQGGVIIWDVHDEAHPVRLTTFPRVGNVDGGGFTPNGTTFATASDRAVKLWSIADPAHPVPLATIQMPGAADVISFDLSVGGHGLVIGLSTGKAYLYDVTDPARPRQSSTVEGEFVEFSPDGRILIARKDRSSLANTQLSDVSFLTHPA